jgi:hypothetical protein
MMFANTSHNLKLKLHLYMEKKKQMGKLGQVEIVWGVNQIKH